MLFNGHSLPVNFLSDRSHRLHILIRILLCNYSIDLRMVDRSQKQSRVYPEKIQAWYTPSKHKRETNYGRYVSNGQSA